MNKATINIDKNLHKKLKLHCAIHGVKLGTLVDKIVEGWLEDAGRNNERERDPRSDSQV